MCLSDKPVSVWSFQAISARNSSGLSVSSRYASILRSLSTVGRHALALILFVEPLKAFMGEVSFSHRDAVNCSLTLVKDDPVARSTPVAV